MEAHRFLVAAGAQYALSTRHVLLSVLFFQEPNNPHVWIAQALEHDIAAHGHDVEATKRAFERTLSAYVSLAAAHQQEPFAMLKPAPAVFWEMWQRVVHQSVQAERLSTIPAFMLPAVTYEPLSTVDAIS